MKPLSLSLNNTVVVLVRVIAALRMLSLWAGACSLYDVILCPTLCLVSSYSTNSKSYMIYRMVPFPMTFSDL